MLGMSKPRLAAAGILLAATALALGGCGTGETPSTSDTSDAPATSAAGADTSAPAAAEGTQIVIDTTFDVKTTDPGRTYDPTGTIIVKALYDTLVTFADDDATVVIPSLATYTVNDDATEFTFTLEEGRVFSDGTPVTADDAVWSLTRLQGMKGNPAFLLDGVTITKVDDLTVKMTTEDSAPALPAILCTPAMGILNSKVVQAQGGTADESDAAEAWLNANSAGSGPYTLESFDITTQAVMVKNPNYNGSQSPYYDKVILRNVDPTTQKMNVERGESQVALGLSGDQITNVAAGVNRISAPSATVVFLLVNRSAEISSVTSTPEFLDAVKQALDYDALAALGGEGAAQATGLIPTYFMGALPQSDAPTRDLEAAKANAEAAGVSGADIVLSYPNDIDPAGYPLALVAQTVQAQLKEAGIEVTLAPAPYATEVDAYRDGKEQIGLWYWNPDYMDPANYLAFGPGQPVGLRANWNAGDNPAIEELVAKGYTTGDPTAREAVFTEWAQLMNTESPFVPIAQPAQNFLASASVANVIYSPVWTINVAGLKAA